MDDLVARAPARIAEFDDDGLIAALRPALPRVQRIALALTNDPQAADDLVADAVTRILPKWRAGTVRDPGQYLKRVTVNLATRRWRRRALGRARDHRAIDWSPVAPDVERIVVDRDLTMRAIRALPPRRRAIVVLRYYDDLSLDQIAELLGIDVGTVKSQLSRALEQLRTTLEGQER